MLTTAKSTSNEDASGIDIASASSMRHIAGELMEHRPVVYLIDLTASCVVGYGMLLAAMLQPSQGWSYWICCLIAALGMYRAGFFIHEIAHFRHGHMRSVRLAWNVLMGMPSFMYDSHRSHHNNHHYGTPTDGEYLPLGSGSVAKVIEFMMAVLVYPVLFALRFLVITPVSFVHPRVRRFVLCEMSSLVINFKFRRDIPPGKSVWNGALTELLFSARLMLFISLFVVGVLPWRGLIDFYVVCVIALGINQMRTVLSHKYLSDGSPMSHQDQIGDSINIEGSFLFWECMFPLGSRYHALHHALPTMPYHSAGLVHRRIVEALPDHSSYRRATYSSPYRALAEFSRTWMQAKNESPSTAQQWYMRRSAR